MNFWSFLDRNPFVGIMICVMVMVSIGAVADACSKKQPDGHRSGCAININTSVATDGGVPPIGGEQGK